MQRDIIVGYDGSPHAQAALLWALDEAARTSASVELVYADESPVLVPAARLIQYPPPQHDSYLTEVIDSTLTSVLSGLHHASGHMRSGGVIVNTASFVGTVLPVPIAVPYAAAKAGVVAAGRSAAPLLADAGLTVYTLCPWVIDTPMVDRLTGGAPDDKDGFAAGFAPSGRLTPVDDVARAAVALLTDEPRRPSGEAILVDAGPTVTVLS